MLVPFSDLANDLGAETLNNPRKFKQSLKVWIEKVSKELVEVTGHKLLIQVMPTGVLLFRQNIVPGSQRMKPSIENRSSAKLRSTKSRKVKELETDWVLEKEIEAFETGLTTSISQKAIKYKQIRDSF